MARTHYTATFPAASPGDQATWPNTVKVYPDANTQVPLGSVYLDESRSLSVYSDAASVALTVGTETLTVTTGSPSATGASPAPTGGSSPVANIVAKAIDYTASSGDVVLADASGGNFAVTLPVPVATATVTVKNVGASGTVTIAPHAAELIDGASGGIPVTRAMSSYLLASDGTDWWVI